MECNRFMTLTVDEGCTKSMRQKSKNISNEIVDIFFDLELQERIVTTEIINLTLLNFFKKTKSINIKLRESLWIDI